MPSIFRTPGPPPRSAVVERVLRDNKITAAEVAQLQQEVAKSGVESAPARELLDVMFDPRMRFAPNTKEAIAALLRAHGYEVSDTGPTLSLSDTKQLNAFAPDLTFQRLSAAVSDLNSKVTIAVVDGGFAAHPALSDNLPSQARYGAAIGTQHGRFTAAARAEGAVHGTHVAGIATAGTSRIKPALHAVPLATAEELREDVATPRPTDAKKDPLYRAIAAAAKDGARVVNISIESFVSASFADTYRALFAQHPDTLFVFGAGNDRVPLSPAATNVDEDSLVCRLADQDGKKPANICVVGASYPNGSIWNLSNHGASVVDLAARGHYIHSADSDGEGGRVASGTSMAAPQVTNTAAKLLLLDNTLSPAQLVRLMALTADPHASWADKAASGGTNNPDRAMTAAAARTLLRNGTASAQVFDALQVPQAERAALQAVLAALG
jgi:subtilisin family serine protease